MSPAIAQPRLDFDSQTPSFPKTLSQGNMRVEVNYAETLTVTEF